MKVNRKIINNSKSSFTSLSVFIVVALVIVIAVITWGLYTGIFSDVQQKFTPSVGMIQDGDYILITNIQNGPVKLDSTTVQITKIITGTVEGTAIIQAGDNDQIDIGDTIVLTAINSYVEYRVLLKYDGKIVGTCDYFSS